MSYAPSFGLDEWKYDHKNTERYRKQLLRFKAVSIREESGVDLCRINWGIKVEHVLDPTFLLDKSDYTLLSGGEEKTKRFGRLFYYFLDEDKDKNELVTLISEKYGYRPFTVNEISGMEKYKNFRVQPPVQNWIKSFIDSDYVVTDSYHGCIFSIIFNKPFTVWGNKQRGMARFISLLKMFGLQDRLVLSLDSVKERNILKEMDWENINKKLEYFKNRSEKFLEDNLGKTKKLSKNH